MDPRTPVRLALCAALLSPSAQALGGERGGDLAAVKRRGVLRHLGVPYANFVTGGGDGFDVELMTAFARSIGVRYEFVATGWADAFPDLTGRRVSASVGLEAAAATPVRGDVLANGVTILPWREKVVSFSAPYFPTQVWVMARADSPVQPIRPSGSVEADIRAVRALLAGRSLLGVPSTCLDPGLYQLDSTGARVTSLPVQLNEVAPALLKGDAELSLLDVADAMIALERWPAALKVIGPISVRQDMAVAFRRDEPQLRAAFDAFLAQAKRDGTYQRLVARYFPEAPVYFPEAFGPTLAGAR